MATTMSTLAVGGSHALRSALRVSVSRAAVSVSAERAGVSAAGALRRSEAAIHRRLDRVRRSGAIGRLSSAISLWRPRDFAAIRLHRSRNLAAVWLRGPGSLSPIRLSGMSRFAAGRLRVTDAGAILRPDVSAMVK